MSAGSTVIVSVWQDGEEVTNFEFDIQPGNVGGSWIGTCTGLSPCAAYNVTAEVVLIDGSCNTATIRTVIERTTTN
jgi:hypothetical protein